MHVLRTWHCVQFASVRADMLSLRFIQHMHDVKCVQNILIHALNTLLGCCRLRALSVVCTAATSEVKNEWSEAVAVAASTAFNYFPGGDAWGDRC